MKAVRDPRAVTNQAAVEALGSLTAHGATLDDARGAVVTLLILRAWEARGAISVPTQPTSEALRELAAEVRCTPSPRSDLDPQGLAAAARSLRAPVEARFLGTAYQALLEANRAQGRRSTRRRQGSYYTPRGVVDSIVELALRPLLNPSEPCDSLLDLRLLDPAAGSGWILLGALRRLTAEWCRRDPSAVGSETRIARQLASCLAGADRDAHAVSLARASLQLETYDGRTPLELPQLLVGDSLLDGGPESDQAVRWREAYPGVFARGGFDSVLGNPPYQREVDGREAFARVRRAPLGAHAHSKGDLWFLFSHLALDLLRPGGTHAFVVPSYWLKATGPASIALRARIREKAEWRALVDLERLQVFGGVAGRHLVFALQTHAAESAGPVEVYRARPGASLADVAAAVATQSSSEHVSLHPSDQGGVYGQRGEVLLGHSLSPTERELLATLQGGRLPPGWLLSEGVTANPERLTARHIAAVKAERGVDLRARGLEPGAPVFVVPHDWDRLATLTPRERELLLPFVHPRGIERLRCAPPREAPWLIYSTHHAVNDPAEIPTLSEHLAVAREVLERRRETRRGARQWFHVHWPRRDALHRGARVVVPRMTSWPWGALAEVPFACGESVYTLVPADRAWSPYVAGLLDALPFALGIALTTKSRGKGLDIPRAALASCPWPAADVFEAALRQHRARGPQLEAWLDAVAEGLETSCSVTPLARVGAAAERLAGMRPLPHEGPWSEHPDRRVRSVGRALDEAACALLEVPYAPLQALARRLRAESARPKPAARPKTER